MNAGLCYLALYTGILPGENKLVLIPLMTGTAWLVGVWGAFLMDELFKTVVYTIRWRSKKWQKMKL